MYYYPTTRSNDAAAAAQNKAFVLMVARPVDLLSLVFSVFLVMLVQDMLCTCITIFGSLGFSVTEPAI